MGDDNGIVLFQTEEAGTSSNMGTSSTQQTAKTATKRQESRHMVQKWIKAKKRRSNVEKCEVSTQVSSSVEQPSPAGVLQPGDPITLDGVVWKETDNGILVVNVNWRGRNYTGTLLDCNQHSWAGAGPRREGRSSKVGGKSGKKSTLNSSQKAPKDSPQKNLKTSATEPNLTIDIQQGFSEPEGVVSHKHHYKLHSPILNECPCNHCERKYTSLVALKYHQNHRHRRTSSALVVGNEKEGDGEQQENLEAESLAKLFRVVDDGQAVDDDDTCERATGSSAAAYSDISSDDNGGVATVKKLSPATNSDPELQQQPVKVAEVKPQQQPTQAVQPTFVRSTPTSQQYPLVPIGCLTGSTLVASSPSILHQQHSPRLGLLGSVTPFISLGSSHALLLPSASGANQQSLKDPIPNDPTSFAISESNSTAPPPSIHYQLPTFQLNILSSASGNNEPSTSK